jgi:hypothetical protein
MRKIAERSKDNHLIKLHPVVQKFPRTFHIVKKSYEIKMIKHNNACQESQKEKESKKAKVDENREDWQKEW